MIKSVLQKRKLILLTPDELRMEKLQARRRGREYAQWMAGQVPRLEPLKSQLSSEMEPHRIGVVDATESGYYELSSYFDVGGKLLALSVKVNQVEVVPVAIATSGDSAVTSATPQPTPQVAQVPSALPVAAENQVVPCTLTPTLTDCHHGNPVQEEALDSCLPAVFQAAREAEQLPAPKPKAKRRSKKPITPEFVDITFSSDSE